MDTVGIAAQIEAACRELGLDEKTELETLKHAAASGGTENRAALILARANERFRSEIERLSADNETFRQREQAIMDLIGGESPEKILHDLRNVLNELALLKAVVQR